MRLIPFAIALFPLTLFALSGSAAAQSWKEYSYPDFAFTVSFPAEPKIETTTYQTVDGRTVPARVYSAAQDSGQFKMTIADLSNAGLEESAVIDQAIKTLSQSGEIKVNIPARVSRVFGRQLSILGTDGSRSSVAMFYNDGRLYQIEGKSLPPGNATADAIRFQQSLIFTGNGSNRAQGERGPRGDRARDQRGDRRGDRRGDQRGDRAGGQRGAAAGAPETAPAPDTRPE
jgi:hypothetical protein